ncbi:hypothetical protein [Simiduia aestuariiviva]|uniref:Putative membrane protein YqjE n=1 Tax=Simiduia aestuariiviva TaxID=1510459 RepID=A0A839UP20_9GAMM|nr:hypothetical protein [Simiduia aestuariiviva]MBB3167187.1 putative membrane protein YqjE [Simiduia aestuariiviva]
MQIQLSGISRHALLGLVLSTAALLSVPLIAMQFTEEVDWQGLDFLVMGGLLLGLGSLLLLVLNNVAKHYRVQVIAAFAIIFLVLWAELAVGVFTQWGS